MNMHVHVCTRTPTTKVTTHLRTQGCRVSRTCIYMYTYMRSFKCEQHYALHANQLPNALAVFWPIPGQVKSAIYTCTYTLYTSWGDRSVVVSRHVHGLHVHVLHIHHTGPHFVLGSSLTISSSLYDSERMSIFLHLPSEYC